MAFTNPKKESEFIAVSTKEQKIEVIVHLKGMFSYPYRERVASSADPEPSQRR